MSQAPVTVKVKGVTIVTHRGILDKALDALTGRQLLVGIPRDHAARDDTPITNASIGYIMEKGSAAAHIPARPWLVPGVANARTKIVVRLVAAGKAALAGKVDAVEMQYQALGFECVSAVQRKITTGPFAPLAESTVRARIDRRKSKSYRARMHAAVDANLAAGLDPEAGLYKPLIDTGQLRRSVTFVIRPR